jgi:SAM-dependent methyltransferase
MPAPARRILARGWNAVTALLWRAAASWMALFMVYVNIRLMREKIQRYAGRFHGTMLDLGSGSKPYRAFFNVDQYIGANAIGHYGSSVPPDVNANTDVWIERSLPLPFGSGTFDGLVCFQVLSVIDQPGPFFAELARVLVPGGALLVTTDFLYPKWGSNDCLRHTDGGLRSLAEANGFDIVAVESFGGFWTALHCIVMRYVRDYPHRVQHARGHAWKLWLAIRYIGWLATMPAWAALGQVVFVLEKRLRDEYTFTTNLLMVARRRSDSSLRGA